MTLPLPDPRVDQQPWELERAGVQRNFEAIALAIPLGIENLKPKVIYGLVSSTGSVSQAGSGDWTVAKNATGDYTVTSTQAFTVTPAVIVTPFPGGAGVQVANLVGLTTSTFRVSVFNSSTGANVDCAFSFWAIGAR